jgi:hypothetical protein
MDKKRPDGKVEGKDLPDAGNRTGVTETYGGNLDRGYQNEGSMGGSTKSDKPDMCKSGRPQNA